MAFNQAVREVRGSLSTAVGLAAAGLVLIGCDDGGGRRRLPVGAVIATTFVRGDANNDGRVDLSDGIHINNYLFLAGLEPVCLDAADADDSGFIDVSDPVFTWNHLFRGGPTIPAPFPDLGQDESVDELTCDSYLLSVEPGEQDLE